MRDEDTKPVNMRPPILIAVRHGETNHNAARKFQGQLDIPLNDRGRQQAASAGQYLAGLARQDAHGRGLLYTGLLTSDLVRASETAQIIYSHLNPKPQLGADPRLREIDVGILADRTFDENMEKHPALVEAYLKDYDTNPNETPYPEGESRNDVAKRILSAFDRPIRHQLGALSKVTKTISSPPSPLQMSAAWNNIENWRGTEAEIWVSHGAALGILLQALGVETEAQHLGNAHCWIIGHSAGKFFLLHHAKTS
jgi:probable phosphoglycerate mutase